MYQKTKRCGISESKKEEVGEKELVNHDIKVYVYLLYFKNLNKNE